VLLKLEKSTRAKYKNITQRGALHCSIDTGQLSYPSTASYARVYEKTKKKAEGGERR
jgi:hypothetical protein